MLHCKTLKGVCSNATSLFRQRFCALTKLMHKIYKDISDAVMSQT